MARTPNMLLLCVGTEALFEIRASTTASYWVNPPCAACLGDLYFVALNCSSTERKLGRDEQFIYSKLEPHQYTVPSDILTFRTTGL